MEYFVKGTYRRSIFTSDKGYIIGLFKLKETNDPELEDFKNKTITFTGYFHELNIDDMYEFVGSSSNHPKYGFQFNVTSYERLKPSDKEGLITFLTSDIFKGVGEKLATNIVETLGEKALDKILEEKESLYLVPKITKKKVEIIYEALTKYEESHKIIVYLNDIGFNMREALLLYNFYKKHTITKIENNIYEILEEINELSFIRVDRIARNINIEETDPRRIRSLIIYTMKDLMFKNGDVYLDIELIYQSICHYLNYEISITSYEQYLSDLMVDDKIVREEDRYYLSSIYEAERNIIYRILKLINKETKTYKNLDSRLENLSDVKYNDKQKEAITRALTNNLLIITGGPGTGKTTIIKAIIDLYKDVNKLTGDMLDREIALLAPTGRASKRMSEKAIFKASTIHRFLKWNKENGNFSVNEYEPSSVKCVIIDEVSMIDIELFHNLLLGLKEDTKIILVGDFNQLPSVGPGQILKDFIESDVIDTVNLEYLYRQDEDSYINELALEINDSNLINPLDSRSDYQFLECNSNNLIYNLKKLCIKIIKKGYDYKRLQIMAPMYKGLNGIDNLNKNLQEIFNPKNKEKEELVIDNVVYRENDKILQLVNNPEDNVYNGDIGIISKIIKAKNEIYIDFDGNEVVYTLKDISKIRHGFVISIHKSQGSEFDFVILPIVPEYSRMLYKKLIYTGVTRAKNKLIIIGNFNSFSYAVNNNIEYIRKTTLKEKLSNLGIKE
jgi:helicase, putative, RecD/TraA family